ncbi:UNVERIFIED_CONTAM: hypothetical protein Slati_1429700 [Sesamum latifolium]|uniref:DUF4283 domain-containing protein n=1 Tax=Sesamum latifolium TaxID=2727402 RepID=A0AAW2X4P4_9LAMI
MRVFKWTPAFNPREESLIVSIWVRLLELPIQFFDKEALFSIGHLLGTPLRTDVSMATLVRPSVAWVCVEINLLELLQTEVGLGFGTEMFIQPCFMSGFQRASAPVPDPDRADLRVKLDAQWARRDLNNHRKGKRVVFEASEARVHPKASASGSKRDGEEMHDCDAPETVMKEEGGTMSEMGHAVHEESTSECVVQGPVGPIERRSDIVQATAVAREVLPGCVKNTLAHDFSHLATEAKDEVIAPTGEGVIQTDEDEVVRRVACHRRGRSMGDGGGSVRHSSSPDRGRMVLLDHEQLLHLWLESNRWPKPIFVTAVYVRCDIVERQNLWDALRAISVGASPWIVGGDFNTVLSLEERSGGAAPSSVAMSDFHDVIADCALLDAGYTGSPYTWYSSRLRQCSDRVPVSSCWMDVFPKMQVTHLELSKSDDHGLLVVAETTMERKASSFWFQHMWAKHPGLLEDWNKVVFGNVIDRVVEAERDLKEADEAYDLDPCDRTLVERNRCSTVLVRGLAQEEAF